MSDAFVDAAKRYLKRGLHPIPCEPPRPGVPESGKRPLVAWKKYQDEAPSWDDLEAWWHDVPTLGTPNLAVVLGRGFLALDIDGTEGMVALEKAGVRMSDLFRVQPPMVSTGKGLHLYYRGNVPDRVSLVEKVDIRGVGYVIAPPSRHWAGHEYRWAENEGREIPPAPASLVQLINASRQAQKPVLGSGWAARLLSEGVSEGRNHAVARLAGYLWGCGVHRDVIEVLLWDWVQTKCKGDHPYSVEEFNATMNSITRREGGPRA